jgi:MFS family permease
MHRVAEGWLAYRLSHSPLILGLVAFAGSAPAVFLSPLAGVVADRVDRRRMLMVAQTAAMLHAFILAVATLSGWIQPQGLVLFAFALGIINAFENPARQSFFPQLVPREDLMNAIALNATLVNMARILGPSFAGLIVATYGEGYCFLANGASYLAVITSLSLMSLRPSRTEPPASQWESLREGFHYARENVVVRSLLLLFAVMNLTGSPYLALLPMLAGSVLRVGAEGLGGLVTASGLGALACSLVLAGQAPSPKLVRIVAGASLTFGSALIGVSLSRHYALSLGILPFIGGSYILILACTQTLLQNVVPDHLRGRVMSFYSLVFLGFPPLGSLLAGWIAEHLGVASTLCLGGSVCVIAGLSFARHHRRIQHAAAEAISLLPGPLT